jgi:hypothetical protein
MRVLRAVIPKPVLAQLGQDAKTGVEMTIEDAARGIRGVRLLHWILTPHRGRVSNFGDMPATGDHCGFPADSDDRK